jgi:hypothetical protein
LSALRPVSGSVPFLPARGANVTIAAYLAVYEGEQGD